MEQPIQNAEKQDPRSYKLMSKTEFSRILETLKKSAKQLIQANDTKARLMKVQQEWKNKLFIIFQIHYLYLITLVLR